jgi:hypothetical protein
MTKPFPAFCRECKHSKPEAGSEWNLRCQHPVVNASDPWALSNATDNHGTECRGERGREWFTKCGMSGKLWEPKETT